MWKCDYEILIGSKSNLCQLLEIFAFHVMVVNTNKFQMMFLGPKTKQETLLNTTKIRMLYCKQHAKLLGIEVDKLKFDDHTKALNQKVCKKLVPVLDLICTFPEDEHYQF